jgi:RNA polymerase sigma factor (TIGR02999 family)
MARERPDHTLQATALVNEAYLKLVDSSRVRWQNRAHFMAVAAQLRRILVDFARQRHVLERGGGAQQVTLHEGLSVGGDPGSDLVALDDALKDLAKLDPRKSQNRATPSRLTLNRTCIAAARPPFERRAERDSHAHVREAAALRYLERQHV